MTPTTNNQKNNPCRPIFLALVLVVTGTAHVRPCSADTPASSPEPVPATRHIVSFFNGDTLQGNLLSVSQDGVARWQHTIIVNPVEFDTKEVATMQLPPSTPATKNEFVPNANLTLTNGDVLNGMLTTMTRDTLTLDTAYAGRLIFPRRMISEIMPIDTDQSAWYVGPNSAEEWTPVNNSPAWTYEQGELVNVRQGFAMREIQTGDRTQIEIEFKWRDYNHLRLMLYREIPAPKKPSKTSGYTMLDISGNRATIQCFTDGGVSFSEATAFNQNTLSDRALNLRVLIDRPKKTLHLMIDDELVKTWQFETKTIPFGTGIGLISNSVSTRIGKIRVCPWTGYIPIAKRKVLSEQDTLHFNNQDTMTGQVESIADNQVTVATGRDPIVIPMNRVASIRFSDTKREIPRRRPGDARCTFVNGGALTIQIQSIQDGRIACVSENFGAATINLAAFNHILFNIYSERHHPSSSSAHSRSSNPSTFGGLDFWIDE